MKKYVFFDFDGTVFDTAEGITKSTQYALKKLGIEAELNELMCFCGPPLTEMFSKKYGFDSEKAEEAVALYRERYRPIGWEECSPFAGMHEMILKLREKGITTVVTTSKPKYFTDRILEKHGMTGDFDLVCGSEFDGTRGKKWEVIDYALKQLNITAAEAVLIGDRMYDVDGAKKCGMDCIGVRFGYAEPNELEEHGAIYVAENPEDLYEFLMK